VQARTPRSAKAWAEFARRAEDLGYSVLSMPDHLQNQFAPLPALAAAAAVTQQIRLGTWVLANDFRHPVMLAKEAATLDLLSDGRLELGIGAGWMTEDYATAGIQLERPGVRIERLAEAIRVLRGLWEAGPFMFSGRHYTVSELDGRPKPLQRPLPLVMGGGGPRILALAAREANIIGLAAHLPGGRMDATSGRTQTLDATLKKLAWVREAAGPRLEKIELQARVLQTAVGEGALARSAELAAPFGMTPEEMLATPHALVGPVERIIEHLLAMRERHGLSYFTVNETAAEELAPVVQRLAGP